MNPSQLIKESLLDVDPGLGDMAKGALKKIKQAGETALEKGKQFGKSVSDKFGNSKGETIKKGNFGVPQLKSDTPHSLQRPKTGYETAKSHIEANPGKYGLGAAGVAGGLAAGYAAKKLKDQNKVSKN